MIGDPAPPTSTQSRVVIRGQRDPYGFTVIQPGCRSGGAPAAAQNIIGHTTNQRSVSITRPDR